MSRDSRRAQRYFRDKDTNERKRRQQHLEDAVRQARGKWIEAQASSTRAEAAVLIADMDRTLAFYEKTRAEISVSDEEVNNLLNSKP